MDKRIFTVVNNLVARNEHESFLQAVDALGLNVEDLAGDHSLDKDPIAYAMQDIDDTIDLERAREVVSMCVDGDFHITEDTPTRDEIDD